MRAVARILLWTVVRESITPPYRTAVLIDVRMARLHMIGRSEECARECSPRRGALKTYPALSLLRLSDSFDEPIGNKLEELVFGIKSRRLADTPDTANTAAKTARGGSLSRPR